MAEMGYVGDHEYETARRQECDGACGDPECTAFQERTAWDEYQALLGKTVLVKALKGCTGMDWLDVSLDPPIRVKIVASERADVVRWVDDHLDPLYSVEPVDSIPEIADLRSLECYGTGFNGATGEREPGDIVSVLS